ncbi:hydrogenase nickel incorporation protein HypB [Comamonadaceae bacterium G21597-S1]|nr:hydrogenase nickel incorporation protein HypB [Comamonadaceae bacterium G21597-S1]
MCVTCGCSGTGAATTPTTTSEPDGWHTHADGTRHTHAHTHAHTHGHDHAEGHDHGKGHAHESGHDGTHAHAAAAATSLAGAGAADPAEAATRHAQLHGRTVRLEQDLLARNQLLAERNRGWFAGRGVLALNLVSSPGSGKTSVLERTIRDNHGRWPFAVVEGDQATQNDADRIRAAGADAVQINTGTGCHLDAAMLQRGLDRLRPPPGCIVMIENVGNLVCPALFDLGEAAKVLVMSVTEGEDKPVKYPHMFRAASLLLLNKIDLLPHLDFDVDRCIAHARSVNPEIEILRVSARSGQGMEAWYQWLQQRVDVLAHVEASQLER